MPLVGRLAVVKRYTGGLFLVICVALVLRLIHLFEVADTPFFEHLHTDPAMYHRWAVEIVEGDWLGRGRPVFYLGPLYPYFLAVVFRLFGTHSLAAGLVQVILSAGSAGLTYHLGRRLFGPATGLLAGLAAAGYGMFIFYSSLILGATLIIFLDLLALVSLGSGVQRPRWWKWVLGGVFLGLSACARGNVILFGPVAVLAIVGSFGIRRWTKWLPACLCLGLAFLATISPLTLHNWLIGRDSVPLTSNAGANFFIGNSADADGIYMRNVSYKGRVMGLSVLGQQTNFPEVARDELGRDNLAPSEVSRFWMGKTLEEIGADPARWLRLIGNKLRYTFNAYEVPNNRNYYFSKRFSTLLRLPLLTYGVVVPLGLMGVVVSWRGWRKHGLLLGFFLAHVAALLAFFVNGRYRLVMVPVVLVYAAVLLGWLYRQVCARRYLRFGLVLALVLAGYAVVYHRVPRTSYRANYANLGNACRYLGQLDEALQDYDRSIAVSRTYYYAYYKKGQLLTDMGRMAEAREVLDQGLTYARRSNDQRFIRLIVAELRKSDGS